MFFLFKAYTFTLFFLSLLFYIQHFFQTRSFAPWFFKSIQGSKVQEEKRDFNLQTNIGQRLVLENDTNFSTSKKSRQNLHHPKKNLILTIEYRETPAALLSFTTFRRGFPQPSSGQMTISSGDDGLGNPHRNVVRDNNAAGVCC